MAARRSRSAKAKPKKRGEFQRTTRLPCKVQFPNMWAPSAPRCFRSGSEHGRVARRNNLSVGVTTFAMDEGTRSSLDRSKAGIPRCTSHLVVLQGRGRPSAAGPRLRGERPPTLASSKAYSEFTLPHPAAALAHAVRAATSRLYSLDSAGGAGLLSTCTKFDEGAHGTSDCCSFRGPGRLQRRLWRARV